MLGALQEALNLQSLISVDRTERFSIQLEYFRVIVREGCIVRALLKTPNNPKHESKYSYHQLVLVMGSVLKSRSQEINESAEGDISVNKPGAPDLSRDCNQRVKDPEIPRLFRKLWSSVTDDNPLTLFGFRRFRTSHLLNLRLLEEEIDQLDHKIFQAGLNLGIEPTSADKLGLKNSKRDKSAPSPEEVLDPTLVSRLRQLLKDYGKCVVVISSRYLS